MTVSFIGKTLSVQYAHVLDSLPEMDNALKHPDSTKILRSVARIT
jgi:hypothetical protein